MEGNEGMWRLPGPLGLRFFALGLPGPVALFAFLVGLIEANRMEEKGAVGVELVVEGAAGGRVDRQVGGRVQGCGQGELWSRNIEM
jgi:hypothetical protein